MKNTFLTILFIISAALSGFALDNLGRIRLGSVESGQRRVNAAGQSGNFSTLIIEISDDSAIAELEQIGAVIFYRRDDLLLTAVPEDMVGELDNIRNVTGCASARTASLHLDKALPATNVPQVLEGTALPRSFSGKGVVVGFSDDGFDPGHAAFKGRVKAVIHTVDTTATVARALSPSEIENWTTDDYDNFHATHVAGVLAGAEEGSPYQGVARGADIVATTSTLDDVSILVGVEEIIALAKEAGKPAVINLSLGTTLGPHDGTDLFCRYLDLCAEDAAIVLAAGNDGETRVHAAEMLSTNDPVISTMLESTNWADTRLYTGYVDIWSSDSRPLELQVRIWDRYSHEIIWSSGWVDPSGGELFTVSSEHDEAFSEIYDGILIAASELCPYNGRFNITVGMNMKSKAFYPENTWSRYSLVIDAKGEDGAFVDVCCDGKLSFFTTSTAYPWVTSGDSDLSISSMACGFNTIAVGSATTRDSAPLITGGEQSWAGFVDAGTVSNYSSYGTSFDGRKLPHFCAPGAYIVSAYNRHVLEKYPEMKSLMAYESPSNPGNYYYAECGTSMAAPHTAGIFALWLEANPALSGTELRDIAVKTARYEGVSPDNPRTGAGMIDAAAGLKLILDAQGIFDLSNDWVSVWRDGNRLALSGHGDEDVAVEIYSLAGHKVYVGEPSRAILPEMPLIVKVIGQTFCITRKLM